jgi:hypothetical protein
MASDSLQIWCLLAAGVAKEWFEGLGIGVEERPTGNHAVVFNASFPWSAAGARLRALYTPWSFGGAATALPEAIRAAF